MREHLRVEYEKYLARYGLKPRKLQSKEVREASQREMVRFMYEQARSRNDPMAESVLIAYEKNCDRYLAETRHPTTILLERTAAEVEETIRAIPKFAEKFHDNVFVGDFPTGSVNCETVKVDGGFLVLVNSGTLMMLQQVINFLWLGNPDEPESPESLKSVDGVAEVLAVYIKYGDPVYGPRPLAGGMLGLGSSLMAGAAQKFVIAHEYGHILAGHLPESEPQSIPVQTDVGVIDVIRKNHEQEFEADDIGYHLTLGVGSYGDFDLTVIDRAAKSDDPKIIMAGSAQKCRISGPFVLLTVDAILDRFTNAARSAQANPAPRDTHPTSDDRLERLLNCVPGTGPHHSGFLNFPFMLLPSIDRILRSMAESVFRKKDTDATKEQSEDRVKTEGDWLDDLLKCAKAIRSGDFATAALLVTDAWEKQGTILETDSELVQRELVRATLGRETNVREAVLEQHRNRRAVEQYVNSADRRMTDVFAGLPRGPRSMSIAGLSEVLPKETPKGIGLMKELIEETDRAEVGGAELHLLNMVVSSWQGERERALSSLEAALTAGIADPESRLAQFVALEKRALNLKVPLDIQKMLVSLGLEALSDTGSAGELARLIKAYTEYLDIPLGPLARRMVEAQLERGK